MPKQDSRVGQLNAVIDPKLLFLAKLAARYKGQTLIEFIEDAFKRALSIAAVLGDEPTPGHEARQPKKEAHLWFESMWHEDDVVRLFNIAGNPELLTPKQRDIFVYVSSVLMKQGKKVTLKNFVQSFDAQERSE
jgi:hypothetical protein